MPQIYLHYFGNESSESLLEAYGIKTKDQQKPDPLLPKQCPNCSEPCRRDDMFCPRCRMVLTYNAYSETLQEQKKKESEAQILKEKYERDLKSMREEIRDEMRQHMSELLTRLKPEIIKKGLS
jgi:integrase/recombinase XerD